MLQLRDISGQIGSGLVRTVVPILVAWLSNLALVQGLGLTEGQLTTAVAAVIGALYWLVVRALEVYVSPKFGRLLGASKAPVYGRVSEDGQAIDVTSLPKP